MALEANIGLLVTGRHTTALDLGTAALPFGLSASLTFADGTAANQANRVFTDTRTLAASATEDLDLAAVLVDAFGAAITFVKVKGIFITAAAGNTNNVRLTRPAANGFALFLAASDGLDIPPGGFFAIAGPALAGLGSVTAGTADLITLTNSGAGTSVTYSIVIIGTNA